MSYTKVSDLQSMNGIYIRTITEGMQQYSYYILEGTKEQHYEYLAGLMQGSNASQAYADFYFKRINDSNIGLLKKHLTKEQSVLLDKLVLDGHKALGEEEFLLVELTEEILKMLLEISYQECLFSSFYFTDPPCTVWSNYGGRFLVFTKNEQECDPVLKRAQEIGFQIER